MKTCYVPGLVLAAAMLAGPSTALASTITVTGLGFYQSIPLLINTTTHESAVAGQILVTVDATNLVAFCVDLFTDIGFSTYNTTLTDPLSYPGGARAAWIFESYAPGVSSNVNAAALQLALWDVIHDGGDGLNAGNVRLDSSGSATLRVGAETIILASAGRSSSNATILRNVSFSGRPAQTLITSHVNTPEPGTLLMTAAGLLLTAFGHRRFSAVQLA